MTCKSLWLGGWTWCCGSVIYCANCLNQRLHTAGFLVELSGITGPNAAALNGSYILDTPALDAGDPCFNSDLNSTNCQMRYLGTGPHGGSMCVSLTARRNYLGAHGNYSYHVTLVERDVDENVMGFANWILPGVGEPAVVTPLDCSAWSATSFPFYSESLGGDNYAASSSLVTSL
jgi:hypothetical protein